MLSRSKKVPLRTQKDFFRQARSLRAPFGVLFLNPADVAQVSVIVQKQRFSKASLRTEIRRRVYREVEMIWDQLIDLQSQIVLVIQTPAKATGSEILQAAQKLIRKSP